MLVLVLMVLVVLLLVLLLLTFLGQGARHCVALHHQVRVSTHLPERLQ